MPGSQDFLRKTGGIGKMVDIMIVTDRLEWGIWGYWYTAGIAAYWLPWTNDVIIIVYFLAGVLIGYHSN